MYIFLLGVISAYHLEFIPEAKEQVAPLPSPP